MSGFPAVRTLRAVVVTVAAAVAITAAFGVMPMLPGGQAHAQTAPSDGVLRGTVTMGTNGASLDATTKVEVIALEGSQVAGTVNATVQNGRYEVRLPVTPNRTYVPRVMHAGVPYFGDPFSFSGTTREATRDFTVYATTDRAEGMRTLQTIVTVVAVDRTAGELGLLREDIVSIGGDRVFMGGTDGVTFRIPAPDGTIEAVADQATTATFQGGVLAVVQPIEPFSPVSIVTRYRVQYDRTADRLRLRTTVPVATDDVIVRVPRDFVTGVRPVAPARRIEDQVFEDAQRTVLQLVRSDGRLDAGQSVLIDLDGMAGVRQRNPLTEQPGASIAVAAALLALGALGLILARRRGDA